MHPMLTGLDPENTVGMMAAAFHLAHGIENIEKGNLRSVDGHGGIGRNGSMELASDIKSAGIGRSNSKYPVIAAADIQQLFSGLIDGRVVVESEEILVRHQGACG